MGKTIRFTELVKASGRPHVATLWGNPEQDADFGRAIRENRILTIKQNATAQKRDFGTIGFLQERNVSYLVFPAPLPKNKQVQVVGIKYELLEEAQPVGGKITLIQRKAPAKPTRTPKEKTFAVTIKRTATIEEASTVRASTAEAARELALKQIHSRRFDVREAIVHDEVRSVDEE